MAMYNKLIKNSEGDEEPLTKAKKKKSKNCIVEYIVSLSGQETKKVYIKHGFLGKGGFANCFITQKMGSDRLMATKVIDKSNLKSTRTKIRVTPSLLSS